MYSTVYCLTLQGWPDHIQKVPQVALHFWGTRDELSTDSGLLLKGTMVCIPLELLDRTLADLHGAHQESTGCRPRQKNLCIGLA